MRYIAVLCLLICVQLNAQSPRFSGDSLRPGVKTRTYHICGYSTRGDSTGLVYYGFKQCDVNGRIKLEVQPSPMEMDAGPDQSVSSWFYSIRNYVSTELDSTWYKYDSKGRVTEYRWHSKLNGKRKTLYSYDALGRCIKKQQFVNGKLNYTETFEYDKAGRLSGSTTLKDQKKTSWQKISYDSLGRELMRLNYRMEAGVQYIDTFSTSYGMNSVTKTGGWTSSRERNTTVYTEYDSVLMYCHARMYKGKWYRNDTTSYVRDSVSHLKLSQTSKSSDMVSTIDYYYTNGALDSTVAKTGDVITETVVYTPTGYPIRKNRYRSDKLYAVELWYYTPVGDLLEERLYNPHGILVQREVYSYTYY